jgi:hypothetical protein
MALESIEPILQTVQEVARREVDRHQQRMIGLTASTPRFVERDNGKLEYVVDVRVGSRPEQGLVKDVLIASWAQGIITDFNIPVLIERSAAGQLTITARAVVKLPNVRVTSYSFGSLGIPFASNLEQDENTGLWYDGFGYPANDPNGEVTIEQNWEWQQGLVEIDEDPETIDESVAAWVLT